MPKTLVQDPLHYALDTLLKPAGLNEQSLDQVLGKVLGKSIDYADLYFQSSQQESWILEDGLVKDAGFSIDNGVGVRALSGEKTGYAYSDDIVFSALIDAADAAKSIASMGSSQRIQTPSTNSVPSILYPRDNPLKSLSESEKIVLLRKLDAEARRLDSRVQQVIVSLSAAYDVILMVSSQGNFNADIRPLVRLGVSVIVEENGKREQAGCGGGGRWDYRYFLEQNLGSDYVQEAVRQALVKLRAKPAPAGMFPVVLGPGWPGVLLHEAIGHGLEGDFNRKGSSAFSGRIGERVASEFCTIVDDGTLPNRRGSLTLDDEGTPTESTILIENGILKGYMQDNLNARLMNTRSTGNGRRESYAYAPMPRMTNTYMLAGKYDPKEIIASVDRGIYAASFGGGQVDITSGKFVFDATEAYLIENGKITHPVKGATLIGNGPDILTRVSMVGNDLELDKGVGTCGKDGQSVPVGVGQPTLKIDSITVGGTQS